MSTTRDVVMLYMALDEAAIFTGSPQSNPDIDALQVLDAGSVVRSLGSDGLGRIENDQDYGFADQPRFGIAWPIALHRWWALCR